MTVIGASLMMLLGGWLIAWPWLYERTGELGFVVFAILLGSAFVLSSVYSAISYFYCRIEIYKDKIRDVNLFFSPELTIDEIKGFRILPTPYVSTLLIVPDNPSQRTIKTALAMEGADEIIEWADRHLTDLDEIDTQDEIKQILADSRLGPTEEQRIDSIEKAGRWARILNILGFVTCLWAFLWPEPYDYAIFAAIVSPLIAVGALAYFDGALRFDEKRGSFVPSIAFAFIGPMIGVACRAFLDWNILSWQNFWMPFFSASIILVWLLRKFAPDLQHGASTIVLPAVFAVLYCYGAVISLNGILDSSSPATHQSAVVNKRVSSGRSTSYYLMLSPWGPRTLDEEVEVPWTVHDRYEVGDEVEVVVRGGRFGIPWYYVQ